ncbi:MAG: hypothetical protein V1487_00600 [bacterium]
MSGGVGWPSVESVLALTDPGEMVGFWQKWFDTMKQRENGERIYLLQEFLNQIGAYSDEDIVAVERWYKILVNNDEKEMVGLPKSFLAGVAKGA